MFGEKFRRGGGAYDIKCDRCLMDAGGHGTNGLLWIIFEGLFVSKLSRDEAMFNARRCSLVAGRLLNFIKFL